MFNATVKSAPKQTNAAKTVSLWTINKMQVFYYQGRFCF